MDYTLDTTGGLLYVTATKNLKIGVGTGTVTGGTRHLHRGDRDGQAQEHQQHRK